MAKKTPAPVKTPSNQSKQLLDAIVTVRQLQEFIREHGTLEKALDAAVRVNALIKMTGGFDQLKEALEVVGKEPPKGGEPTAAD